MLKQIKKLFSTVHFETKANKKSNNTIALEVLMGKWGSGNTRKKNLTKAGYDYNAIQKIVNDRMTKKPIDTIAHEVIDGKWGAGNTRKKCLEVAGYNYNKVQDRVNEILKPTPPGGKTYPGTFPSYRLVKTNAKVISDTIKWAKWISSDKRFHYGCNEHAYHNGCYFCGTQYQKKNHGIKMYEFTYCCNPFVGAAWAHGGGDAQAYKMCHNCNSWDFTLKNGSYEKSSLFDKLGKPSYSKLKPGDVLCNWTHAALYIGNGKVVQASGKDDNVPYSKKWNGSISYGDTWNAWERAYRYNGHVDADRPLMYGEVSDRIYDLQNYLNWWSDGKFFKECGEADGIFGDNTLKWTKAFQEKEIGKGQGDGVVGQKTIEAMKKVKK